MGASYVDVLYQEDEKNQCFEVMNLSKKNQRGGKSNVMLSYTWHTPVDVIVESLVQFCERHERSTYHTVVWICFACNNVKTHQPSACHDHHTTIPPCHHAHHHANHHIPTISMPPTITMPCHQPSQTSCACLQLVRVEDLSAKNEIVAFETFRDKFYRAVSLVENVLALVSPWDAPEK